MSRQTNNHAVKDTSSTTDSTTYITREVYSCLTPCSQCSGVYVDAISGNMLRIICRHQCHSTTNKIKGAANTK